MSGVKELLILDLVSPSVLSHAAPWKLYCTEITTLQHRLGGAWGLVFPTSFCTQQLRKPDYENPNISMVSRSNVQKDMLGHKSFYSWAQSSLGLLSYRSSHPRYALAVDKLNQTTPMRAACRQEWGLDHLWLCSFSTEVTKYWNWGICTGNLVLQMLHGEPLGNCINFFFYISSVMDLL